MLNTIRCEIANVVVRLPGLSAAPCETGVMYANNDISPRLPECCTLCFFMRKHCLRQGTSNVTKPDRF
jgi:hypothetical protein